MVFRGSMPPKRPPVEDAVLLGLAVDHALATLGAEGGGWRETPVAPLNISRQGYGYAVSPAIRREAEAIVRSVLAALVHIGLMLRVVDFKPHGGFSRLFVPPAAGEDKGVSFDGVGRLYAGAPGAQSGPGGGRYAGFDGAKAAIQVKVQRATTTRAQRVKRWHAWFKSAKDGLAWAPVGSHLQGVQIVVFLVDHKGDPEGASSLTEVAVTAAALAAWPAPAMNPKSLPALHYAKGPLAPVTPKGPSQQLDTRWALVQSKAFEADSDGATVVLVKVADLAGIFYKATSGSTRIKRKLDDRGCDVYEVEEAGKHGRAKAHCCSVPDAKAVLGRFPS
jgi:hypothetical protein